MQGYLISQCIEGMLGTSHLFREQPDKIEDILFFRQALGFSFDDDRAPFSVVGIGVAYLEGGIRI